MIDSDFIIDYTNALYSTPKEYAPQYEEFRDMFSSGQLLSKEWLIKELLKLNLNFKTVIIVGSWYGTLGFLLHKYFPNANIKLLDLDPRCEKFIKNVIYNKPMISAITGDMYKYKYTDEDVIINTSCEHIPNIHSWLQNINKGKLVILQSNNYTDGIGHINCSTSVHDFKSQTGINNPLYAGEFVMPMYTRYMIIGNI